LPLSTFATAGEVNTLEFWNSGILGEEEQSKPSSWAFLIPGSVSSFGRKCLVRFFYGKGNALWLAFGGALFSHPFLGPRIRRRRDDSFGETSTTQDSRAIIFPYSSSYDTTCWQSVFIPVVELTGTTLLMHPMLQRRLMK
jgi:hypothetical protein